MSDRSAKLLMEIAKVMKANLTLMEGQSKWRTKAGATTVDIPSHLLSEVLRWNDGYEDWLRTKQKREAAAKEKQLQWEIARHKEAERAALTEEDLEYASDCLKKIDDGTPPLIVRYRCYIDARS